MSESYHFIQDLTGLVPDIPPESIVSRTMFSSERLKAVLFGFAPGQELSEHTASSPAVVHIISGRCRLTLGQDVKQVAEGAWVHMPAHLPHSLLAETPVVMLLLLLK